MDLNQTLPTFKDINKNDVVSLTLTISKELTPYMSLNSETRVLSFTGLLGFNKKANPDLINKTMDFTLHLDDGVNKVSYDSAIYFEYVAPPVIKKVEKTVVTKKFVYGKNIKIKSIDRIGLVEIEMLKGKFDIELINKLLSGQKTKNIRRRLTESK